MGADDGGQMVSWHAIVGTMMVVHVPSIFTSYYRNITTDADLCN